LSIVVTCKPTGTAVVFVGVIWHKRKLTNPFRMM
jgi:hypothetical protein